MQNAPKADRPITPDPNPNPTKDVGALIERLEAEAIALWGDGYYRFTAELLEHAAITIRTLAAHIQATGGRGN